MIKLAPALAHRVIEGQAFIMDAREKVLHSLNGTGTLIWRGLAAGRPPEGIAAELSEAYDVAADAALADVRAFVDALRAKGLLTES